MQSDSDNSVTFSDVRNKLYNSPYFCSTLSRWYICNKTKLCLCNVNPIKCFVPLALHNIGKFLKFLSFTVRYIFYNTDEGISLYLVSILQLTMDSKVMGSKNIQNILCYKCTQNKLFDFFMVYHMGNLVMHLYLLKYSSCINVYWNYLHER